MKILIVRNAFFYDFGGGERFPVHLAKELSSLGHQPIVVSTQPRLLKYAEEQGVPHRHGMWWSKQNWSGGQVVFFPVYLAWQCILSAWYIGLLLRLRPDVVHLQSKDDFIAGTFAGRLLKKRVVWTDHADLKHVFSNHHKWYKNPIGKLVYFASKFAHVVTLVSRSEGNLIANNLSHSLPPNFTVVHNGVSDQKVVPIETAGRTENSTIFCSTSRLVTAKGIGELIKAFGNFAPSEEVNLWLVGDGPEMEYFKNMAGGNERVAFWGHQENPLPILAASDVFVQPTYHEGFSISIVEATMLGKPLIVTKVGGNPEIADKTNSLMVPPKESRALFDAMHTLYEDRALRRKLATGARKRFEEGFDFRVIVKERFVPLYEKTD